MKVMTVLVDSLIRAQLSLNHRAHSPFSFACCLKSTLNHPRYPHLHHFEFLPLLPPRLQPSCHRVGPLIITPTRCSTVTKVSILPSSEELSNPSLQTVLTSPEHGVATVWLVATLGSRSITRRFNRKAIFEVDVPETCRVIISPEAPMALRLQGNLL